MSKQFIIFSLLGGAIAIGLLIFISVLINEPYDQSPPTQRVDVTGMVDEDDNIREVTAVVQVGDANWLEVDGLLGFNAGDVSFSLDLNEIKDEIIPPFPLLAGEVSVVELSPNRRFAYITTGQGGGIGSFIYDINQDQVYLLDSSKIRYRGAWMSDGRLEVVNRETFGENPGRYLNTYRSVSASTPWEMEEYTGYAHNVGDIIVANKYEDFDCSQYGEVCEGIAVWLVIELSEPSEGDSYTGEFFVRALDNSVPGKFIPSGELQILEFFNPFGGDGGNAPLEEYAPLVATMNEPIVDNFSLRFLSGEDYVADYSLNFKIEDGADIGIDGREISFTGVPGGVSIDFLQ